MPVKISTLRSFHAFFISTVYSNTLAVSLYFITQDFEIMTQIPTRLQHRIHRIAEVLFANMNKANFFACMLTKNTDVKKSVCDINIRIGPTSLLTWPWNKWCITFCKFWHLWGGCSLLNENFTGEVHFKVRRQRKFVFNLNFILNYDNYIPILDDNMD